MRKTATQFVILVSIYLMTAGQSAASNLEQKVDSYLNAYLKAKTFSGSILIAKQDKILLSKSYGMANYELQVPNSAATKFHIASVSKTFTATAIMLLRERGQLRLEDPLTRFIPDYPNGDKITLDHLLSHRSGIPNVNSFPDYERNSAFPHKLEEIISWFKDKPLEFEPGTKNKYSNSNYNLLAYVIEKVSSKDYGTFLNENIFAPLQMKDTGHDAGPANMILKRASGYVPAGLGNVKNAPFLDWSIKTGNGSLYSTAVDLYKWDRALYTDKLLKREVIQEMFEKGYGWFSDDRFGKKRVYFGGRSPGFSSYLDRYIEDQICIIVLSNNYSPVAGSISRDLAAMQFGQPYQVPEEIRPVDLEPALLDSYAGKYEFGQDYYRPGPFEVQKRGPSLYIVWGDYSVPLIAISPSRFFCLDFWSTLEFTKDDSGKVNGITYRDLDEFHAKRVQ